MNRRDDGDQSRFAAEEPLFEHIEPVATTAHNSVTDEVARVDKKGKKKILLFVGVIILLALLLIAVLLSVPKKVKAPKQEAITKVDQVSKRTNLQQRIGDLRNDFRQADPSKQPLLFPPLNYKLDITTND